jgi:hypothetical protein
MHRATSVYEPIPVIATSRCTVAAKRTPCRPRMYTGTAEMVTAAAPAADSPWWGCLVIGTVSVIAECG